MTVIQKFRGRGGKENNYPATPFTKSNFIMSYKGYLVKHGLGFLLPYTAQGLEVKLLSLTLHWSTYFHCVCIKRNQFAGGG